jgi:catechol 2,3-dioxygenase-like lactoylglutathione lyase family enzyme
VQADDVLNVRAFGSSDASAGIGEVIGRKLDTMRRSLDATIEYLRMGALLGTVTYPTNSVDANVALYTAFGTTIQTLGFLTGTATTNYPGTIIPALRDAVEAGLGGTPYTGITVLCSRSFFRALVGHATVVAAYLAQQNQWNLTPVSMRGRNRMTFRLGDVDFVEYYSVAGGVTYLPTDYAIAFPTGTDCFIDHCAPADIVEAAGTLGQPMYARQWASADGKSVQLEVQANRLPINTRPRCVVYCHSTT